MMHPAFRVTPSRMALLALMIAGSVHAQQRVVISNGTQANKEIPLAAGSAVVFDSSGNLTVDCALTNGVCAPLAGTGGSPPPTGAPTITNFARNDGDTDLRAGDLIRLIWSTTDAAACAATTPLLPAGLNGTTWPSVKSVNELGGETIQLPVAGNYEFSLQCFNAAGGSQLQTIALTAAVSDTPPPAGCNLPADPLIQPAGWTRTNVDWVSAFSSRDGSPVAIYPSSVGFPVPIGAAKNGYTTIPFTPTANLTVNLNWDGVQANSAQGYPNPRPASSMFVSISPCPGDVRAPVSGASDPWLRLGCRKMGFNANIFYTTSAIPESNDSACRLEAGSTYYLNVMAADPSDGLTLGEHTCEPVSNSANGCDVNAQHREQ